MVYKGEVTPYIHITPRWIFPSRAPNLTPTSQTRLNEHFTMVKIATFISVVTAATVASAFRMSAWQSTGYTGRQFQTTSGGTQYLGFSAASYKWDSTFADGCCVKFCDGGRETGVTCPSRSNSNVVPGNRFNKVVIACDGSVLNC